MDSLTPDFTTGVTLSNGSANLGAVNNTLFPTVQQAHVGLGVSPDAFGVKSHGLSTKAVPKGKRLVTRGTRQRLIGTAGNDLLDAVRGAGKNFLKGNAGNDRLFAGRSDRLFGDAGNDSLDARRGKSSNVLSGGTGNDTLYGKTRDSLDGGQGNDILWCGPGGNSVKGGQGTDRFWIADRGLPTGVNTIRDFQVGIDTLGLSAVPGVTQFSDLTLTQQGANTLISAQGRAIAQLVGITASSLTAQSFVGLQTGQGPTLSVSNANVSERDAGTTTVVLDVTLSAASASPVTVSYQTVAGTATASEDYTPATGTLTFAPGETSKAIAIDIVNDTKDEFDETLSLVLSNPTNATLGNSQAQITIIDNDITSITASSTQSDGSKTNQIDARYDFDLYDITAVGDYRRDEEGNLNNEVGVFSGAIENFTGLIREVGIDPFLKFNGLKIGGTTSVAYDLFIAEPLTLDLRAQFIPRGGTITLPDGTTAIAPKDRVEYRLTNTRLRDEAGLFEWTLILSDGLLEESVIDPVKAVNSIEYMIANQLLAKANQVRFSITSKDNPSQLSIVNDAIDPITDGTGDEPPPPRVVTRSTPPAIPRPVPYNNTIAPINDAIATASDTGLSGSGFRSFFLTTAMGVIPADFSEPSPTRDVDLYKVQLNAGEIITVDIDSFSALDSVLRVFNASGTQLALSDNTAAPDETLTGDSYLQFQASTAGAYYIGVSGANNTAYNPLIANSGVLGDAGEYNLEIIIREPNSTIGTAIDTELGSPFGFYRTTSRIGDVFGLASGLDVDFYQVQLNAGDLLTIDIDTNGFAAGQGVDSVLRLFNARGAQLAFSDDNVAPGEASSNDSYLSYTATTAGTYYIGVSGYNNSSYDPLTGTGGSLGGIGFYTLELNRTAS